MVFIWRGAGILVPILFFICGWIVSYWFEDTRLGNPEFIGWTCLTAGIVNFIIGLGLLGIKNDSINLEPGEIPTRKKHDFFWIPVFVWGLLLGGLSAYLLIGSSSDPSFDQDEYIHETVEEDWYDTERVINYYNPTDDTMSYFIEDDRDFLEMESVAPHSFVSVTYDEGTYLIAGFNYDNEIQLSYSDPDFVDDGNKYTIVESEDEDGEVSRIYHRILNPGTKETKDYDQAWVVLTGLHDLILVDVTSTCSDTITKSDIESTDWIELVVDRYDGRDLIEPMYGEYDGKSKYIVMGPGETIPLELKKKEVVYALIVIPHGLRMTNDYLIEKIIEVTF